MKFPVPPKVVAVGDSVLYGYGDPVGGGWIERLRRDWMQAGEQAPILYNLGVRGDTIQHVHRRWLFEFQQRGELRNQLPQATILSFGVNDSARLGRPDGRHMTPFATYQEHLGALLDEARDQSQVLFIGMVPVDETKMPFMGGFFFGHEDQYLYKEATRLACQERGIPYLDIFELWRQRGQAWISERLMPDGLHPNAAGYEALYENVRGWSELDKVHASGQKVLG